MVTDWVYDAGKIGDKVNSVTHARNKVKILTSYNAINDDIRRFTMRFIR